MTFTLPNLDYPNEALEPVIDSRTMQIHHTKHHQGYTDKLNKLLSETEAKKETIEHILANLKELPQAVQMGIRNNGGGYYNHCLYWQVLAPESDRVDADPTGELSKVIDESFGSFDAFKEQFENAGLDQFGSGWAWLSVEKNGALAVFSTPNQDNPLMDTVATVRDGTPIFGIDVWEHAYYLQYQNKRKDYLKACWNIVNWKRVAENYQRALEGKSIIAA